MADKGSLASKTVLGAMWLLLWRVFTRIIGLGSTLVLARLLVPADFGLLAMASTFAAAIEALSQLGLQDALVRRQGDDTALYDTAFTLQMARALLTTAILAAGAAPAASWFNEPRLVEVVYVLAFSSAIGGFENIGIVEFRRNMRFDAQFQVLLVPRLLQVATTIPLAFAFRSYWAMLAGIVVSRAARTIMTYVVHPYRPAFQLAGWRTLAGFSFWTWATCAASLVWDRCDPFILGPRLGPERLGIYLLAMEIAILPVTELIAPVADALFAGFSVAQKDGQSSLQHAPWVAATMLLGLTPVIIVISCVSNDVVSVLLGPKWLEAQPLIGILVWQCLFSPFSWVSSVVMIANGKVRANFIGNVIVSVVKLVTLLVAVSMTSRLDLIAAATAVCVAIESSVYLLLLKSVGDVRLGDIAGAVLRILFAGGISVLALVALGLGWRSGVVSPLAAILDAALAGIVALVVYIMAEMSMWYLAGRPQGPEQRVLAMIGTRIPLWRKKLSVSRP